MTQNKSPVLPTMNSADERAALVAWLREKSDTVFDLGYHDNAAQLDEAADAIERGEHLNQGKQEAND